LPPSREDWLRGLDLNQRPSGYEPDELPGCSTPHLNYVGTDYEIKLKDGPRRQEKLSPAVGFVLVGADFLVASTAESGKQIQMLEHRRTDLLTRLAALH
jgi:hypothetical protein